MQHDYLEIQHNSLREYLQELLSGTNQNPSISAKTPIFRWMSSFKSPPDDAELSFACSTPE
jgi:hypothetical protein